MKWSRCRDFATPHNFYHFSNRIPWIVIGICYLACPILLLTARFILVRENKKRDAEPVNDAYEEVYMEQVTADGKRIEVRVDKVRPRLSNAIKSNVIVILFRNSLIWQTSRIAISVTFCRNTLALTLTVVLEVNIFSHWHGKARREVSLFHAQHDTELTHQSTTNHRDLIWF